MLLNFFFFFELPIHILEGNEKPSTLMSTQNSQCIGRPFNLLHLLTSIFFFSVYPCIQEEAPRHFRLKLPSSFSLAVQSIQQEFLHINLSSPWKLELF